MRYKLVKEDSCMSESPSRNILLKIKENSWIRTVGKGYFCGRSPLKLKIIKV